MKKRILGLAALLAFTTCFTGCDAANGAWDKVTGAWDKVYDKVTDLIPGLNKPDDVEYDAEGAADWLLSLEEEKASETRNDYSLPNTWNFRTVTYTVEWSVAETEAVTLEKGATETLVKVNKMLTEDTDYVLTAKVIAGDGTFAEITLERTVLAMSTTVAAPITSAPVEGVMYKYHIYQAGAQQDCYFVGLMDGYYFKTSSKYEDAVDLYVEYVEGSTTDFYVCFNHPEDASKQYIGVKVSDDGAHNNIVFDEEPVSTFVWNADLAGGTITTTILDKDGVMSEFYLGNYSKDDGSKHYTTVSASTIDNASASTSNIGHLVGLVSVEDVKASEKLAQAQRNYGLSKFFFGTGTYELPTANETFPDVTYTYEISGEGATLEGNVISYAAGTEDKTATLKVTFNCGNETALTKECTFTVSPIPTVPAAGELTIAEALALDLVAYGNGYNGGKTTEIYTITGVVTSIKKEWDPAYNNMEVYMSESLTGTTSILVYRLSTQVEVGDKIVVTGKLGYYSGSAQVAQGATAEIIGKETLPEAPSIPATWPVLEENTAYKFYLAPEALESKPYYFNGSISSSRYLGTTENVTDAVDVFVEKSTTSVGYSFYFMNGTTKTYLNVGNNDSGKLSILFATENPAVYAYDEAGKVWYTNFDGTDYYLGTYTNSSSGQTFTTVSASKLSYINADNTGVSQFPAKFVLSSEVVEPSMPATWPVLEENTAYKFYLAPEALESKPYYFNGSISSSRYLGTTENVTDAVDVFVEKSTTSVGYSFYFMNGTTKTYLNVGNNDSGKLSILFATENPAVYAYDEAGKVWYTNFDGTDYYLGTYTNSSSGQTFTTVSASKLSYINADNTGVSQFPAKFVLSSEVSKPADKPEESVTASISFADKAQRTSYSTTQQVWSQNGITVTNDKGSSTNNVGDYAKPMRSYKNSTVKVEFTSAMKKIVFDSNKDYSDNPYLTQLKTSLEAAGYTCTVEGTLITVELATPATSLTFTCTGGQCRIFNITVYA